mmetsp:Transcript_65882/g.176541  ORF Transcript_65882/g.176541 Transcript_65882/m.176541 type:complete len:350 (-) Transcript_65882:82-1131(-)
MTKWDLINSRLERTSEFQRLLNSSKTPVYAGQVGLLEREREGRVIAAHAPHRRLQLEEATLLDARRHLGAEAARDGRLVTHHAAARLAHAGAHRLGVPRQDRPQVNELARGPQLGLGAVARRLQHPQLRAVAHHGHVAALLQHLGAAQGQREIPRRHLLHGGAVQGLGLQEDDGIGVADAREEETLGLRRRTRNDDNKPRSVSKICLRRLRMIQPSVTDCTVRGTNCKSADVKLSTTSISIFGRLVDNLIEGRKYVICKLNFRNGCCSHGSHANSKSSDSLFTKGRIEHALLAKHFLQSSSCSENTSESDIFSKDYSLRVSLHSYAQSIIDSSNQIHFLQLSLSSRHRA